MQPEGLQPLKQRLQIPAVADAAAGVERDFFLLHFCLFFSFKSSSDLLHAESEKNLGENDEKSVWSRR